MYLIIHVHTYPNIFCEMRFSMINYPDNYFDAETRDGFYIEEKMKRAWAAQIEVLDEIRRVCRKLEIPFFADWGTLLGAVRHKGFIPWDDDLDIGMLRNDYTRFLNEAPAILDNYFELKSLYNDPTHDNVKCRVISGRHMNFDKDYLNRFHGCPYVVGIDIFPIDYIPKDKEKCDNQLHMIELVLSAASSIPQNPPYNDEVINLLSSIEHSFNVSFNKNNRPFHELKKLVDILCAACPPDESKEVCSMIDLAGGWDYHIPVEMYGRTIEMPFEATTIPVPVGYDTILRTKYGADYMTPINRSSSHDYPFYKKQEAALKEVIENEFHTTLSDSDFNQLLAMKLKQ